MDYIKELEKKIHEFQKKEIQKAISEGNYRGILKCMLNWDIPQELKEKIKLNIK